MVRDVVIHKYGKYTKSQIVDFKKRIMKTIFLLLVSVDPDTASDCKHVDVQQTFDSVLFELGGASTVFFHPEAIVEAINLLEYARKLLHSDEYTYAKYRKLILDAGATIGRIKEV